MSYHLEWVGHACALIKTPKHTIIIDPFLDHNPKARKNLKTLEKVNLILLTHAHFDHMSEAIPLAQRDNVPILCVPELAFYIKKIAPDVETLALGIGGLYYPDKEKNMIGIKSIKMVSALHSSSLELDGVKHYAGLAAGFVITLQINNKNYHIYHAGDTALTHEMKNLKGQVHLAMFPVDGRYNMGLTDTIQAIEWIQPEIVIPIHYNTFPEISTDPSSLSNPYGKVVLLDQKNFSLDLSSL